MQKQQEPSLHEETDGRVGLALWGPVGRWLFLNWPRGSWQYDVVCLLLLLLLLLLPGA